MNIAIVYLCSFLFLFKFQVFVCFILPESTWQNAGILTTNIVVGPFRPTACQYVRNTFGVPSFLLPYFQTLYKDCSHIEDVHFLFCADFIKFDIFSFSRVLNLGIFPSKMIRWCLVYVMCILHYIQALQ